MLQDVVAHRHTELEVLKDGVVAAGRDPGVHALLHELVVTLVHDIELWWNSGDEIGH